MKSQTTSRLLPLVVTIAIGVPLIFLCSLPFLRNAPEWLVWALAGFATVIEISASLVMAAIKDKRSDEWHRGAHRFGTQWGWQIGAGIITLLIVLPPVREGILAFANWSDNGAVITERSALLIFLFGFVCVVMMQAITTAILSVSWRVWMSRAV